jgi:hypothetical protein
VAAGSEAIVHSEVPLEEAADGTLVLAAPSIGRWRRTKGREGGRSSGGASSRRGGPATSEQRGPERAEANGHVGVKVLK